MQHPHNHPNKALLIFIFYYFSIYIFFVFFRQVLSFLFSLLSIFSPVFHIFILLLHVFCSLKCLELKGGPQAQHMQRHHTQIQHLYTLMQNCFPTNLSNSMYYCSGFMSLKKELPIQYSLN